MGEVKIPVNSGELPAFVSIPERGAPWPGVVVLHDVSGMREDLRNQTRWLAAFFDVIAATPQPRIFWEWRDITDSTQSVVVGERVLLSVTAV